MVNSQIILRTLLVFLLVADTGMAWAQLAASGSETVVNSLVDNAQKHPDVAMDANGNFVVVYESYGHDQDGWAILGQRYNANGTTKLSEFTANTTQFEDQRSPAVAMDAIGNFAVVFMSQLVDGFGWGIMITRFDSSGFPEQDTLVNSTTIGEQRNPDIAMDHDGDLVVVWASISLLGDTMTIAGQRLDSSGARQGNEFQVNTTKNDFCGFPRVGMAHDGSFVVVWQALGQDGDGQGIFAQRYDASGATRGSEFQVNTTTSGNQQAPAIALDSAGNFVIAWQSYAQDGSDYGIYAQRFLADGNTVGSEFKVNTSTSGAQEWPEVSMTYDGQFVIAWTDHQLDGSNSGVYLKMYDAAGAATGSETMVNTTSHQFQQFGVPVISPTASSMVVAWQDGQHGADSTADGDDFGTVMQLFTPGGAPLPVQWRTFQADKYNGHSTLLTWTTASEVNNAGFFVQRFADDPARDQWADLGFVPGQGYASTNTDYAFIDDHPQPGNNYYRLKQVDLDGTMAFSETRVVHFDPPPGWRLFPNPTSGALHVQRIDDTGWQGSVPFMLTDALGKVLLRGQLEGVLTSIDLRGIADGVYHLAVYDRNGWQHQAVVKAGE